MSTTFRQPTHIKVNCNNENTNNNTNLNLKSGQACPTSSHKHCDTYVKQVDDSCPPQNNSGYSMYDGCYDGAAGLWAFIFILFLFAIVFCALWWCAPCKLREASQTTGCVDWTLLFLATVAIVVFILFLIWLLYKLVNSARCAPRRDVCC